MIRKHIQKHAHSKKNKSKKCTGGGGEELCCPVCELSLARHPNPKPDVIEGSGQDATEMRNEIRAMQAGKFRDAELVVAAICGHLFHRFCLRHYCFVYQQANNSEQVECPCCFRNICMSKYQSVDYKAHLKIASTFAKELNGSVYVNQELNQRKEKVIHDFSEMDTKIAEAKLKLETYRSHQKNLVAKEASAKKALMERETLYQGVEHCNKGIDTMHKENINILKMYLTIMKDQPKEFLRDKRIPAPLIPHLTTILGDDTLLRKFGEIIKPIQMAGLRSNTEILIKEILAEVEPKVQAQKRIDQIKAVNEGRIRRLKPSNPVVVKVKHSSVSIFSRSELDDSSLKTIMKEVNGPINSLKDAHNKFKNNRKNTNLKKILKSASDILILLKPRCKKQESNNLNEVKKQVDDFKVKVPPRRCKSTDPVLIKVVKSKALLVSIEDIKQIVESNGLEDGQQVVKTDIKPDSPITTLLSCKVSQKLEVPQKENLEINTKPMSELKIYESMESQTCEALISIESKNSEKIENPVFNPNLVGSVLEMIYEDVKEDNEAMSSLVEDVSKITFQKKENASETSIKKAVIEYSVSIPTQKISTSTSTNSELVQKESFESKISPSKKIILEETRDVESGLQINELNCNKVSRKLSGPLQGILPGPFLIPKNHSNGWPTSSLESNQTPGYQFKCLKKLPSMNVERKSKISTYTVPSSLISSECFNICQPPNPNSPKADEEWGVSPARNQPFGDMIESVAYSSCKLVSPRHTVINIPSSNTVINFTSPRHPNQHIQPVFASHGQFQLHNSQHLQICPPNRRFLLPEETMLFERFSGNSCHGMSYPNNWSNTSPRVKLQCNGDFSGPINYAYDNMLTPQPPDSYRSSSSSPRTGRDSMKVKQALVELCRGLSPPKTKDTAQMEMQRRNGYTNILQPTIDNDGSKRTVRRARRRHINQNVYV